MRNTINAGVIQQNASLQCRCRWAGSRSRIDLVLLTQAQERVERPAARREAGVFPLAVIGDEPGPTGIFYFLTHVIHFLVDVNRGK